MYIGEVIKLKGFTLVEFIVTIVLLGVIASTAFSHFLSGSAFTPSMTKNHIISVSRFAQQAAMSRQNQTITLQIDYQSADDSWQMQVLADAVSLRTIETDANDAAITATASASSVTLSAGNNLILEFNGVGDAGDSSGNIKLGGADYGVGTGVDIAVAGGSTFNLCITSAGLAYESTC